MIFRSRTSARFFEDRYRAKADPWNFADSEWEQKRFAIIIAALSHKRYERAMEPACSIGTLTERLASLCTRVDAFDFSETAVAHARQRCATLGNVHIECSALTEKTSMTGYDLVAFSEVGYYFRPGKWRDMVAKFALELAPGATVLASHWLGQTKDHPQSADQVHEALRAEPLLQLEIEQRHEKFRLDRFVRL